MTLHDLGSIGRSNPEQEIELEAQEGYPDEVLESEWSPVMEEIHNILAEMQESS